MQAVLKSIPDDRLRAYIVWLPCIRGDDRVSAIERSKEFTDSRLLYYWDEKQLTGLSWNKVLSRGEEGTWNLAWDVYLIYGAGTKWQSADPPVPDFWMHQLRGVEDAPRLDSSAFESKVREFLNRIKK